MEILTICIALFGAVLGIINTYIILTNNRVKIKVNPTNAFFLKTLDERERLAVDITNLSSFALTISEVGLYYRHTRRKGIFVPPIVGDGGSFPRRLEPRESFTIYSEPDALLEESFKNAKCVYIRTACGVTKKGKSKTFKTMVSGQ